MQIECENCGSSLEIEESDVSEGYMGMFYTVCPVCNKRTYIDELEKELTADNFIFPDNFYHFGGKHSYNLNTEDIKEIVKEAITFFRTNPDNFCFVSGFGDTFIAVYNFCGDEEYRVDVAKGYYEVSIPFQKEDYEKVLESKWKNDGVVFVR